MLDLVHRKQISGVNSPIVIFGKHFSHGIFASVKCPFRNRAKENEGTKKRPTAKIKKGRNWERN
jgi:hypothetical protein